MATRDDVKTAIQDARQRWERYRETIVKLTKFLDISTTDLADEMGMTRPTMTGRLKGYSRIEPWELPGFALALGVPVEVLDLEPDEAVRWILDHPTEVTRSRYSSGNAQRAA
jgi:hypothetical protein